MTVSRSGSRSGSGSSVSRVLLWSARSDNAGLAPGSAPVELEEAEVGQGFRTREREGRGWVRAAEELSRYGRTRVFPTAASFHFLVEHLHHRFDGSWYGVDAPHA